MEYLSLDDMAAIAAVADDPAQCIADLARRLGRPYFTVNKAVHRVREAGGWYTRLVWIDCIECGQPLLSRSDGGRGHRTAHPDCERARIARWARERRELHPGLSTPYVRKWKAEHPDELAAIREREKEQARAQWPSLPEEKRAAMLDKLHESDRRDYPITLELASARGDIWDPDEDQYILEHQHEPARDVALHLERTLWGVRGRKVRLRKMGLGK